MTSVNVGILCVGLCNGHTITKFSEEKSSTKHFKMEVH